IDRMFRYFEEFVLKTQACLIRLHRSDCVYYLIGPGLHVEFAQLLRRGGALARVMVWKSRVPPDARVNAFGKIQPFLISARLAPGTVEVNQVRTRNHSVRGL